VDILYRNFPELPPEEFSGTLRASVPEELQVRNQWTCWRLEERNGKTTKVPYNAASGHRASSTDSATWASYEEAVEAVEDGGYNGVGFVFSSGDPYTGIDLDKCRNPQTGEVAEWAQPWLDRFSEGYSEVSPSGTGLHIIVRGKTPHNGKKTRDGKTVEIYSVERFFTVTGWEVC